MGLMSASRCLEMKVWLTIVISWLCFGPGFLLSVSDQEIYMDPQIGGFNNTNVTSGPIIAADKRTLFVADFLYTGPSGVLQFWAGEHKSPYNDSDKILVYQNNFPDTSTNFYLDLPENLTTDNIYYLQITLKNQSVDYVLFETLEKSGVREYNETHKEDSVYRIPKCCPLGQSYVESSPVCQKSSTYSPLDIQLFESNETGLDPDLKYNSSNFTLIPYYRNLKCGSNDLMLEITETNGLIYNSTLIVQGIGILSHREFCTEILRSENSVVTISLTCLGQEPSEPNLYLPALILSTICFALSAAAYAIILSKQDVHKRCFIMFSSWMCLAFISLIVMQLQNDTQTCNGFGFFFIFTVVLSFLWLLILCLELVYQVRRPVVDERYDFRWYWYCGISSCLALIILMITLISGERWIPDVPNTFIMPYGDITKMCRFETPFARAFITFFPIIVSIIGSFASLVALQTCMNKNEKNEKISNHHDWVFWCNSYKFLSRTYLVIICVAGFWILNICFYSDQLANTKTQLALDVIKASLGLVTFIGFVGNKYTLREICEKFAGKEKKKVTEDDLGLSSYPTPVGTPRTPPEGQPFLSTFHQLNGGNNT